ncbi:epimerase [Parahaliea sp. F7430]|uniref:Epimerase n=1 Tax=Sediminihaliea albiluteola TaxID=2758564 RepID=A0A7W2YKE4_9GAMM|nr:epimerase [Sediminihaliea albiluteola]MBA6413614.1 epimerase [Sediminihaliea albiluteola]
MEAKQHKSKAASRHVAVLGCGDLGLRLQASLAQDWHFTALRRNTAALPAGIAGYSVDYTEPGALSVLEDLAPDYLITTLKPLGRDAAGYRRGFLQATEHVLQGLGGHRPKAILMVSSTRVYAEQEGAWVDEDSAVDTVEPAAAAIVAAENLLLESAQRALILRCGGIYGAANSRLLSRIAAGELCAAEPLRYSNRIHREDVVGFLQHLIEQVEQGESPRQCFNCVDDAVVPQYEVEQWLAEHLGVKPKSERAASKGHKRCSNAALKASAYVLRHPNYRSGYRALLAKFGGAEGK